MTSPIIPEGVWMNSQMSIARHYGGLNIAGRQYLIVNKEGRDIYQLSAIAHKEGRTKAIEAGEPCDLCRTDWIPLYRKLGRDRVLELARVTDDLPKAKALAKEKGWME
ncbi:MAG: hypothetical protein LIP02_08810 [Bacteroidales bacterium]|nr:hypothetical protein [Bacteroidales bacterium]